MAFRLQDIDPQVDFPALARCMFESYEDPPQMFFHVFFPAHSAGEEAREEAIKEAAERLKMWHTHDSTSYWQKVVDMDSGKLAGAALWNMYEENPFATVKKSAVTWFPEDGSRLFVEQALDNHARPRSKAAQRPHIYLFIIFTHPNYRRKGVGQLFMDWGIKKSDEANMDIFLDATPHGRPLYDVNGFEYIEENINIPKLDNPDDAWKEIEEKVGPFTFWLMRRSVEGRPGAPNSLL
ncbi:acyl-CoA N-acyltransferase [Xylaria palmicola]|nr:acyl-CoA N-acyltransferase [Xylaria palmicola]